MPRFSAGAVARSNAPTAAARRRVAAVIGGLSRTGFRVSRPAAWPRDRPLVLLYHGVSQVPRGADCRRLVVSPRNLRSHVAWLIRHRYDLASASELINV